VGYYLYKNDYFIHQLYRNNLNHNDALIVNKFTNVFHSEIRFKAKAKIIYVLTGSSLQHDNRQMCFELTVFR